MKRMPNILCTRTLGAANVARLKAHGWSVIVHDFIQKEIKLHALSPGMLQTHVVLTSQIGVIAFTKMIKYWNLEGSQFKIFCISQATNKRALQHRLTIVGEADDSNGLADIICANDNIKAVAHVCSNLYIKDMSTKLENAGIKVSVLQAYRVELTPKHIARPFDAIVFFSPSAIDSFLHMNKVPDTPCFCIGSTTAKHARQRGLIQTYTPEEPAEDALMMQLENYFIKTTHHAEK
jgi:uroporphyrinogen-III synthase